MTICEYVESSISIKKIIIETRINLIIIRFFIYTNMMLKSSKIIKILYKNRCKLKITKKKEKFTKNETNTGLKTLYNRYEKQNSKNVNYISITKSRFFNT